ncbi:hypothetical protein QCA50_004321 [Cerrena zonata]|uniref:Spindle pole body component n=1 Tax=Cerrena zonata TaxID=2478898 RepID=A0AAW0GR46_9APHY
MTSSAFKLQLQQALFAFGASAADGGSEDHWVPGLSSKLTASGSWPPAGSSLSLSLRTVILDALAQEYDENRVLTCAVTQKIVKEAEWRLGFAIQDLPTDSGHAQWLNARAIQALDFLYLDYNPPKPLDAVITPSILSKYHRIFVFCLRLMRVESVLQSLTYASKSSFHLQSQELAQIFQHFKFMANSFISTLSNYIFTHVIGGFFDKFLQDFVTEGSIIAFDSVEDLKNLHSQVLDNILSACLLRSHLKSTAKVSL